MAKYEEPSQEVVELFNKVRKKTSIPVWVIFRVLCNNKQKGDPVKLFKANDLVQALTEGVNFAVVVNEDIFNQLPDNMKELAFDEVLAGVVVSETDTISLEKPDFMTYSGVLAKYGDVNVIRLKESIKSLYDVQKQKEEQEKSERKSKRKAKE